MLVVFGDTIAPELHEQVIALFHALRARRDARIRNLHPGYASLLIDFDPLQLSHDELTAVIEQLPGELAGIGDEVARAVTLPVCYSTEFGPDLLEVAQHANLSVNEIVRLHSSPVYLVYFLGFSPGFAYLGGLPEVLHAPRLATPRQSVVAGSVGIAGSQTGIYPVDSPGGWRIIGRTPTRMFDPGVIPPTTLQPGDRVRISPIDRATFEEMSRQR